MSEYDNTNKGVLFPNSFKNKPNQPDVRGELNIAGIEFKLSGWIRTKKDSEEKFFSLAAERKDAEPEAQQDQDPIGDVMAPPPPTPVEGLPPSEPGKEDVPF
jgi:hypothetical protein|tara:strand:+ start:51 stop:356 length:306 start_codon:yes stop_codon:yes gene_type:complete